MSADDACAPKAGIRPGSAVRDLKSAGFRGSVGVLGEAGDGHGEDEADRVGPP
ncbi:hypothetical protein BN2537_15921 [Streptomyces venezuelae]|nr:hypothetical protein BN2537_15921 [Streptomyces venezuelae]